MILLFCIDILIYILIGSLRFQTVKLAILGCGFLGKQILIQAKAQYPKESLLASITEQRAERFNEIKALGGTPIQFYLDGTDRHITESQLRKKYIATPSQRSFLTSDAYVIAIPPRRQLGAITDRYPNEMALWLRLLALAHLPLPASEVLNNSNNSKRTIKRIVFISSTSVYADRPLPNGRKMGRSAVVDENDMLEPVSIAGKTLRKIEIMLQTWSSANPDFQVSLLRLGGLVGKGRHPYRFFKSKDALLVKSLDLPTNLIHVKDAAALALKIISTNPFPKDETFNGVVSTHPSRYTLYKKIISKDSLFEAKLENQSPSLRKGKIVDNQKVKDVLNYTFYYDDIRTWAEESWDETS
ncbi:hypothetical protein COTS27_00475 [Spirochaetota bacterium]|nr:hypothetical protein COTS27_00475 [Spirochaetota bacterium]